MKLYIWPALLLISALSLFSCKKEAQKEGETNASFTGTWELAHSSGGMVPATSFAEGNGNLLTFTETTFTYRRNGIIVHQGNYRLATDSTIDVNTCAQVAPVSSEPNTIIFESNPASVKNYFVIQGNSLKITSGCTALDGGTSIYRKVVVLR